MCCAKSMPPSVIVRPDKSSHARPQTTCGQRSEKSRLKRAGKLDKEGGIFVPERFGKAEEVLKSCGNGGGSVFAKHS